MKQIKKTFISAVIVVSGLVVWSYITNKYNFADVIYWVGLLYVTATITRPSLKYWEDLVN